MKNHIRTILGIIFALLLCGIAFSQTKSNPDSDFKLVITEWGSVYYAYVGKSENVVIPNKDGLYLNYNLFHTSYTTVKIKSVVISEGITTISERAFKDCEALTSVKIPSSVTKIGENAFSGCSSLKEITIPKNVTSIGSSAFIGSGVSKITISEGVTTISEGAFRYCEALTSVKIPSSVTKIGKEAFYGCSNLTDFSIPPSVQSIGSAAFAGSGISNIIISGDINIENDIFTGDWYGDFSTNKTLKTVVILEGVTTIPEVIFRNCEVLTSVTIPSTITYIGSGAFSGCTSLTEIQIPSTITYIGSGAFSGCSGLTKIQIPSSVTAIGERTFANCSSLTEIQIPSSVTSIGEKAFLGCSNLKEITIPQSVTRIGFLAFHHSGISKIVFSGDGQISKELFTYNFDDPHHRDMDWVYDRNKDAFNTTLKNIIISEGVTTIPEEAFRNCTALTSVTIASTVTKIEARAFEGCKSLVNVTIPPTVTKIGSSAFERCENLVNVAITEGTTEIGTGAFKWCESLESFKIPQGVTEISKSTFYGCSSLATIDIPDTITYIGGDAFYNCKSLKSIKLPRFPPNIALVLGDMPWGLSTSICENAFRYCISLETVEFQTSDNLIIIGKYAFANCKSLKSLTIPGCVINIKDNAFEGCENLENVTFLDAIPYETACKQLLEESIALSRSIDIDPANFFGGIHGIDYSSDYIYSNVVSRLKNVDGVCQRSISNKTFSKCPALKSIILPKKGYDTKIVNNLPPDVTISYKTVMPKSDNLISGNPFENSSFFTPNITKGEMNISTEPFEYKDQTYTALCISGTTGAQKSDYWEASCISNLKMQEFIKKGDNISFKVLGDGKDCGLHFVLYDDDKPIDFKYEFSTKEGKVMTVTIPYKKLKSTDKSIKRKFKKEEVCDIIISGNIYGKETNRLLWIFDVKVY